MQAQDLLDDLEARGEAALRPVYLVVGEESFLADEVVRRIQRVSAEGGIAGFNDEKFTAGDVQIGAVLSAAKSVPMMAKRRFVLLRGVDRWEAKADDGEAKPEPKRGVKTDPPLDRLAAYAADPCPTAVLVIVASKLHAQRRIVTAAKKGGFIVTCDPLSRHNTAPWVANRAKRAGHPISREVAEQIAELIGSDLGALADAVERLSLFVGPGAVISEDAVATMIAPIRTVATWDLTDALCARDLSTALRVLHEMNVAKGAELMVLGAVASSARKMAHFAERLATGDSPQAAAEACGVPSFKARDMARALRGFSRQGMVRWLELFAQTDVALKGGARRGSRAVLEGMILSMCAAK